MQVSSRVAVRLALVLLIVFGVQPALADPAAPPGGAPGDAARPRAAIDALHASLLDVMKNAQALGYAGREQKLRVVIPKHFDVETMAKQSLGGQQWKAASPDAQKRYLETFERFMVANYAGRFDGFSGQSFETLGEVPGPRSTVIVKSRLIDPTDKNIDLNYRMHQTGGAWKVIDVYLDGSVSELALRRSEFVSIVKRQNLDALLVALDAKIAKLAAGAGAS